MKYKINNYIVDAKSPVKAVLAVKTIKDYGPPYAIWVKVNGKWKIWGGTHSTNIDKDAFLKEGYTDVIVVKNGESPKDSKCKDANITPDELRRFCIKYNYYTSGNIQEYDNLLSNVSKWNLREIASDIAQHSKGVWTTEVWSKLRETFGDSFKDESETEYLSKEEEQAIEDYKNAIAKTKDPKLLKIFGHILKEEVEHLEELQNEELEDSCKNKK